MIYLLDVNALVALGVVNHEFHDRVVSWIRAQNSPTLATCSITELGFVRVLAQAPAYGFTIPQARALLMRLKEASVARVTFMPDLHPDQHDVSHLPTWVRTAKQITDGHLSKPASANGAVLATLDENIPGSHLIAK
jgi:predicted nucleic acid-binding protein